MVRLTGHDMLFFLAVFCIAILLGIHALMVFLDPCYPRQETRQYKKIHDAMWFAGALCLMIAIVLTVSLVDTQQNFKKLIIVAGTYAVGLFILHRVAVPSIVTSASPPLRLVAATAPFISAVATLLGPVLWLMHLSAPLFIRPAAMPRASFNKDASEKPEEPQTDSDKDTYVTNDMSIIGRIMIEKMVETALNSRHTRLPLFEDGRKSVIGILHTRLLARQLLNVAGDLTSLDLMAAVSEPLFALEKTPIDVQLSHFYQRKEHLALVTNAAGQIIGLVTRTLVLEALHKQKNQNH
jgi:CBS domain containing-hemolysin-like protein